MDKQTDTSIIYIRYSKFVDPARLLNKNLNHFRLLEAKIWYKWPEHSPNMGQTWP